MLAMPWLQHVLIVFRPFRETARDAPRRLAQFREEVTAESRMQRCELRLAVLMGTHARLGRRSRLRHLPRDVLDTLLDAIAPLDVHIEAVCW